MSKRILGQKLTHPAVTAVVPVGNVGIDFTALPSSMRTKWWLVTVVVTVAASNIDIWGATPAGTPDDATDDIWGLHQDEYKVAPLGRLATALPIGTYHFLIDGLGAYTRVFFQKSAGTVTVALAEVLETSRGS